MMEFLIKAPGTIGNVGPGFDVLGLSIDGLWDYFSICESDQFKITVEGRDAISVPTEPQSNTVTIAAQHLFDKVGSLRRFQVNIDRKLPLSGGLGASAASSVAGALAAAKIAHVLDDRSLIVEAALAGESAVAGRHLDNIAPCLLGGLTLIQNMKPIKFDCEKIWLVAVTPQQKLNTKDSRTVLPESLSTTEWTNQMASGIGMVQALTSGRLELLNAVTDIFAEPNRSKLIGGFERVKAGAMSAGASYCSISGGGPTCFAICTDEVVAKKVQESMETGFGQVSLSHIGVIDHVGAVIEST